MNSNEYWNETFNKTITNKEKKHINCNAAKISRLYGILKEMNLEDDNKLEVGCGCGLLATSMKWKEKYLGIDVSDVAVDFAKSLDLNCKLADIHEFETEEKFDTILFMDSLEHILHLDKLAFKCRDLLSDKGRIITNIPLSISYHNTEFDYYLREDNVKRFFSFAGLKEYQTFNIEIKEIERTYQFFEGRK